MAAPTFFDRKASYARLWVSMEVRPSKTADINATADKIVSKKARYQAVEAATSVPWYVVGLIHAMEGGCNFGTHLHNGDSLAHRTVQVPAGRPRDGEPPFAWKDSAIDAIRYDGLDKWNAWSVEGICYCLERYNGWGYVSHHPDVNTPYLWSGSNNYSRGKYVADGQWSSTAVSGQSGAMPILKRMTELDPSIAPKLSTDAPEPVEEQVATPSLAFPKAIEASALGAVGGTVRPEADEPLVIPAADPPKEDKPGLWSRISDWMGEFNFAHVNELSDQGSRIATNIRAAKNWAKGIFTGTTGVTGAAQANPLKGTEAVAAAHPSLLAVLLGIAIGIIIISGIAYLFVKFVIEPSFVSASKSGRYVPRGAQPIKA